MLKLVLVLFIFVAVATAFSAENRVVNGTDAEEDEFPYMIALRKSTRLTCGGSILDETHILTAAHCVATTVEPLSIQYGSIYLDPNSTDVIAVTQVDVHEGYTGEDGWINDVAVLTLESPLTFDASVQPIVLPPLNEPTPAGETAILSGWGLNATEIGIIQDVLQKVELTVYSDEECEFVHEGVAERQYHLCAGYPGGGKGQCSGDSGSPLVVNGIQRGIVSWSIKPCTIAPYPGVYANVAKYIDWICSRANCIFEE